MGNLLRVEKLERAGCGVARIREGGVAQLFALAVELLEGGIRHQNLAADFELRREIAFEAVRDIADFEGVGSDVVALETVSAGERPDKAAIFVTQAYGGAVKLEFAAVAERIGAQKLVGAAGEILNL